MNDIGLSVASLWHEILMNSSGKEEVERYRVLMNLSPVEIRILLLTGNNSNMLLRDYASILQISKSTLSSIINRLEKKGYLSREISDTDKRSYCLKLDERGQDFFQTYLAYQSDMGNRIINGLTDTEKQQLLDLLVKISSYMIRR